MRRALAIIPGGSCQWVIMALLFSVFACGSPEKKHAVEVKSPGVKRILHAKITNNARSTANYSSVFLYVTKRGGITGWRQADSTSNDFNTDDALAYGTRVKLIGDTKGWIQISKDACGNCPDLFIPSNCKCLSLAAKLNLSTVDLNAISFDQKQVHADDSADTTSKLKEFSLERISKDEFYRQMKNGLINFKADTDLFSRKKGVLTLNAAQKNVKLADVQEGEKEESYYYLGQYPTIHKFVVAGSYNESSDVFFVDGISGEIIRDSFSNFPYLSENKQFAVCLSIDDADDRGDIGLYAIKKDSVIYMAGSHFQYWMPALNSTRFFWGNDNCFYFLFVPYGAYPETDNYEKGIKAPNPIYKYARIKFTRSLK